MSETAMVPTALLESIPYCRLMGMKVVADGEGLILELPFTQQLIGNPVLPALHGGVIGSLLETAALAQVVHELACVRLPKPVDMVIDYLRSGRALTSFARALIVKRGRRTVNVHAQMWQEDETRPIAALRGHVLLQR
ncbi:MAG: PaaI family thioesterase [Alphaproteobacteria bacterium]|nr:PaaI family thioesterase [Alphaproteobacteria bacterium]